MARELRQRGTEVVETAEPGGGAVGNCIRSMLLDPQYVITDRAELLLFEAARANNVDTIIAPALRRGCWVICDRFTDSSIAYQGCARGVNIDIIKQLNSYATDGLIPDLTILLDLPVQKGLARQIKLDRVSAEGTAFHQAVREGYLSAARAEPERFVVIDALRGPDEVLRQALAAIDVVLDRK